MIYDGIFLQEEYIPFLFLWLDLDVKASKQLSATTTKSMNTVK